MNLKIVEYSSELYQELYTLLKEIYDSNINQTDLEKYYLDFNKKIYVALLENKIVGCAFLEIKEDYIRAYRYGFITYVAVDKQYRKKGIGKTMIEYLIQCVKQEGCTSIELTSANFRKAAHHLYESLGFSRKDTTVFIKELME